MINKKSIVMGENRILRIIFIEHGFGEEKHTIMITKSFFKLRG